MQIGRRLLRSFIFLLLTSPPIGLAQTTSSTPVDYGVWLGYQGNHSFRDDSPWRLIIEGTAKRNKGIADAQAWVFKSGIGYRWQNDLQVAAGYIFKENIPFDSSSQPYKWPEQRIFQQLQYPISFGNGSKTLQHKITLEERWEARKSPPNFDTITSYKYETILRYQLEFVFPLRAKTDGIIFDEVHLRLSPTDEKVFDQNRFFAGFGFNVDRKAITRIEVGYLLQTVRNSQETETGRKRLNNIIRITFISDSPLGFFK